MSFHSSDNAHFGVFVGGSLFMAAAFSTCVLFHRLFAELSSLSQRLSSLRKEKQIRHFHFEVFMPREVRAVDSR